MLPFSCVVMQQYEGLRPQDLRRLKDMLIVETADMLQAPLFTAEALLRAHGTHQTRTHADVRLAKHSERIFVCERHRARLNSVISESLGSLFCPAENTEHDMTNM